MKKIILLFILFFLTGCTQAKQLAHLDQLMTLQDMSNGQDEQAKFVEEQNKKFAQLLEIVKADRLKEYPDKKTILKSFGEPVIVRPVVENGQPTEEWLYRYATKYFNSDKVYLYFDEKGNLSRWTHVPAPAEKVASQ